jgi:hypothetical protein
MRLLASTSMILHGFLFVFMTSFCFSDPHLSNYLEEEFIDEQVIKN